MSFNLTKKELHLAIFVGLMGFFLYSREMILYMDKLPIWQGWVLYNILWFTIMYVGSNQGFFIYEPKKVALTQALGLYFITTAILMTINWESAYVQIVTKNNQDMSNVYIQTDDGLAWYFTDKTFPNLDLEWKRIIAFVVIPFCLSLLGGFLVTGRIHM